MEIYGYTFGPFVEMIKEAVSVLKANFTKERMVELKEVLKVDSI